MEFQAQVNKERSVVRLIYACYVYECQVYECYVWEFYVYEYFAYECYVCAVQCQS